MFVSVKVAVINSQGDRMRVVSIAEEQPKVLAKYSFDKIKMTGVASSPEGYILFVWSYDNENGYGGPRPVTMRVSSEMQIRNFFAACSILLVY
jgi:hypothetical protein